MNHTNSAAAFALSIAIGFGSPALAQDRTDFAALQTTLKQKDDVTVTTVGGDKIKGRMLDVSADRIVVQLKSGSRTVDIAQIQRVQKRKNGILLGALIGLGAGIPFAVGVSSYAYNEGSSESAAFFPIAVGLGAGIGIDAAIGSSKTVYERSPGRTVTVSPMIDPQVGVGGRLAFKF
jgi:hypothetical protein